MIKLITRLSILLIILPLALTACANTTEDTSEPIVETSTEPQSTIELPHLTASQAIGIVQAAIKASTLSIKLAAGWYKAEFNYANRQWIVTTWPSEEDSKKYAGCVYIVDDNTGELLNPPPVYIPE